MKYRVKVDTCIDILEFTVEAENKPKANYKAFKAAKKSGHFESGMKFWDFMRLFAPEVKAERGEQDAE